MGAPILSGFRALDPVLAVYLQPNVDLKESEVALGTAEREDSEVHVRWRIGTLWSYFYRSFLFCFWLP